MSDSAVTFIKCKTAQEEQNYIYKKKIPTILQGEITTI